MLGAVDVDVCNLALSHLGNGTLISSLNDTSAEARACKQFFEHARDEFLRDFPWPFGRKQIALALVTSSEDDDHPTTEYIYSYRYPTDCLCIRKTLSEVRNDIRSQRWTYELASDDQGTLIWTDKENAVIEYTSILARNPARWHSDFLMAFSFRLASYLAPRLTKGDPFKNGDKTFALWRSSALKARANHANEVSPDEEPDSESIQARN